LPGWALAGALWRRGSRPGSAQRRLVTVSDGNWFRKERTEAIHFGDRLLRFAIVIMLAPDMRRCFPG
jgi:hypothetical protein